MKDLKVIVFEAMEEALECKEQAARRVAKTRTSRGGFDHQNALWNHLYWEHRIETIVSLIQRADLEWECSKWLDAQGKGGEW